MILTIGTTPTLQRTMIFDRLKIDDVNRAAEVSEYASGKAINVSRVCATLDAPTQAILFAGGRRGEALLEDLRHAAIAHRAVHVAAQTRLCTTLIDRTAGTATELVEETPRASASEWKAFERAIDEALSAAQVAVFAGTLAPGAPADFISRRLDEQRLTIIDAKGPALLGALAAAAGKRLIAKLNRDELAATVSRVIDSDEDTVDAAWQASQGRATLIVTAGKAGALVVEKDRVLRVTPPVVRAVSAVGSGDAFTAGLAVALSRGESMEGALCLAAACGAANALTAHSGHLNAAEVGRLLAEARVEGV